MAKNFFTVEWLEGHKERLRSAGGTRKRGGDGKSVGPAAATVDRRRFNRIKKSPHLVALNMLDRNPELFKGNQEHFEQVRVFWHFEQFEDELYQLLHATPNGGARHGAVAGKIKAEGQKKGYPDTTLDAPRGIYHGMRLELKYGNNRPSQEQKDWLIRLAAQGYYCALAYGHEEAIRLFSHYWTLQPGETMPPHKNDGYWKAASLPI